MTAAIRIAIDAMSGDFGPRSTIPAALRAVDACPLLEISLVGDKALLERELQPHCAVLPSRLRIVHAPDVVAMDADPLYALRHQHSSSMWRSLELVRDGEADGCVSAGNTGALAAMSRYLLKTFDGVDRPAICKSMPVEVGDCYMLDLGANLVCTCEQLHQFALMGSVLAAASGVTSPKVALLNIGVENGKGTPLVQAADRALRADARLNYTGYIEANSLYSGAVDVVVCDGLSGNIALKASEGVARLIARKVEHHLSRRWIYRMLALALRPALRRLRAELNPGSYNGASFLGLRRTVVKSHGSADPDSFFQALQVAREQVARDLPGLIRQRLHSA
ncbi:phosphate acyltransferase PlsX [Marinimicrobium alkaliphilum]|uniref:phosphate acyltransferase PlsX n=1 Tax=Marinimicrobium alkaliphilum TaxID=2202654 RepID=UPI000DBA42A4|nr:phosphate acyltransferase PlsX [Marinimicrobium alkaliphilum]